MRLPVLALVVALGWGLAGCGGEEPLYDDGSQTVPLAGLGAELDRLEVEVVAPDAPSDATAADVVAAFEDAGFEKVSADTDLSDVIGAYAIDGTGTAGLLALVGDAGGDGVTAVALVFASPQAAAVHAASGPQVFSDPAIEAERTDLLAGNVAVYAVDPDSTDRARDALADLAGVAPSSDAPSSDAPSSDAPSTTP